MIHNNGNQQYFFLQDKHGDIGQQISCCITNVTPSPRGNFIARKLGSPYFVATFTLETELVSSKVRALIDPNNPSTKVHSRIRIRNLIRQPPIQTRSPEINSQTQKARNNVMEDIALQTNRVATKVGQDDEISSNTLHQNTIIRTISRDIFCLFRNSTESCL